MTPLTPDFLEELIGGLSSARIIVGKHYGDHAAMVYMRLGQIMEILPELKSDLDTLAAWKESALAVEASWDCQAVGKLLGIPLGSDIRAGIEPGIRALLARLP